MEMYEEQKNRQKRERGGGVRMDGWIKVEARKRPVQAERQPDDGAVRIDVFFSFFSSVSLFSFSFFPLTIVDPRQSSNRKRRQGGDK